MLVLSRKVGDKIYIGDDIVVTITDVQGGNVRIGIDAPKNIDIVRGELLEEVTETNKEALAPNMASDLLKQLLKRE